MRLFYLPSSGRIDYAVLDHELGTFIESSGYSVYEVDECPQNSHLCKDIRQHIGAIGSTGLQKYFILGGQLNVLDGWQPYRPPEIRIG